MGQITMETNTILNALILFLVGIIGYFLRQYAVEIKESKKIREDFEKQTSKEINEIKFNYLDRFADIKETANKTKEELMNAMTQSEKNLTKLITDHQGRERNHNEN
jgi:DNA-directed RNA polymerase subunit F